MIRTQHHMMSYDENTASHDVTDENTASHDVT